MIGQGASSSTNFSRGRSLPIWRLRPKMGPESHLFGFSGRTRRSGSSHRGGATPSRGASNATRAAPSASSISTLDHGLVHHVGMRGTATIEKFDHERARRVLARYLGRSAETWDSRFRDALTDTDNLFVRFVPDTVVARDVSFEPAQKGEE